MVLGVVLCEENTMNDEASVIKVTRSYDVHCDLSSSANSNLDLIGIWLESVKESETLDTVAILEVIGVNLSVEVLIRDPQKTLYCADFDTKSE